MLSPEDRSATQMDLVMFGMYCIEESEGVARRVDPRLVRIQQQLRTDGLVSGLIEDRIVMMPAGRRPGRGERAGVAEMLQKMDWSTVSTPWRQNRQSLSIWRKNDPGAK